MNTTLLELDHDTSSLLVNRLMAGLPRVFISYRQVDVDAALALHTLLTERYDPEHVFFAGTSIPPHTDFRYFIAAGIATAKTMLVIIGDDWLESFRCNKHLWAKAEIVLGQARAKLTILPILLDNASLPKPEDLPPIIDRRLLTNGVLRLRTDHHMKEDVEVIFRRLIEYAEP